MVRLGVDAGLVIKYSNNILYMIFLNKLFPNLWVL